MPSRSLGSFFFFFKKKFNILDCVCVNIMVLSYFLPYVFSSRLKHQPCRSQSQQIARQNYHCEINVNGSTFLERGYLKHPGNFSVFILAQSVDSLSVAIVDIFLPFVLHLNFSVSPFDRIFGGPAQSLQSSKTNTLSSLLGSNFCSLNYLTLAPSQVYFFGLCAYWREK